MKYVAILVYKIFYGVVFKQKRDVCDCLKSDLWVFVQALVINLFKTPYNLIVQG